MSYVTADSNLVIICAWLVPPWRRRLARPRLHPQVAQVRPISNCSIARSPWFQYDVAKIWIWVVFCYRVAASYVPGFTAKTRVESSTHTFINVMPFVRYKTGNNPAPITPVLDELAANGIVLDRSGDLWLWMWFCWFASRVCANCVTPQHSPTQPHIYPSLFLPLLFSFLVLVPLGVWLLSTWPIYVHHLCRLQRSTHLWHIVTLPALTLNTELLFFREVRTFDTLPHCLATTWRIEPLFKRSVRVTES